MYDAEIRPLYVWRKDLRPLYVWRKELRPLYAWRKDLRPLYVWRKELRPLYVWRNMVRLAILLSVYYECGFREFHKYFWGPFFKSGSNMRINYDIYKTIPKFN